MFGLFPDVAAATAAAASLPGRGVGPGRYPVGIVKRIEVDPSDVRITTLGYSNDPAPAGGPGAWLRRYRLRLAGGLALLEALLWAFDVSKLILLAVAVAAVAFHFLITPRIPSYTFRQVSWVVAFAQALIAIGSILLVVFTTLVAILIFTFLVAPRDRRPRRPSRRPPVIVDLHSDLLIDIADRRVAGERDVFRRRHLPALAAAGVRVQLLAVYCPTQHATDLALRHALRLIEAAHRDADESDGALAIVTDARQLDAALDAGAIAGILTLEGAEPLGREPELVRLFGRLGVRSIGLTWNRANDFADGATEDRGAGITPAGRRLLGEMAAAGIALDLSHLTERGATTRSSTPPGHVFASHSNAAAVHPTLATSPTTSCAASPPATACAASTCCPCCWAPRRSARRRRPTTTTSCGRRASAARDRRRLRRVPAARAVRAAPPAAARGARRSARERAGAAARDGLRRRARRRRRGLG